MGTPNVGADPINPLYYGGDACARIIEHMAANPAFAAKYAWRLGQKDEESQEAAKAIWYLEREFVLNTFKAVPPGYRDMCEALATEALHRGQLDFSRYAIIAELVSYTIDGDNRRLEEAIRHFRIYLG